MKCLGSKTKWFGFGIKLTIVDFSCTNQKRNLIKKDCNIPPEEWVAEKIKEASKRQIEGDEPLRLPLRKSGSTYEEYSIDMLYEDQERIVAVVMGKIQEWLEADDLSNFRPLRLTVNGAAGSGKSVVINTIVTLMRKMFNSNQVAQVAAPTGTAAFNVGGETLHRLVGAKVSKREYSPNANKASTDKQNRLTSKFDHLLALIIDERSLINLKDIGTASRVIAESVYGGGPFDDSTFGDIPVVVLFGDDQQLPSTGEGAFQCLDPPTKRKVPPMTALGRRVMLECAENVLELFGSKRMQDDKIDDKALLKAVRDNDDLTPAQVKKILSLHLSEVKRRHGEAAKAEIESKSIFLFYTNDKKDRHNIRRLAMASSNANPVAFVGLQTRSNTTGKSDRTHFVGDTPGISMLCTGAFVALEGHNFQPEWGLHNGACGTLVELVFKKGHNPNHGDQPAYAVVDFPLYCGPVWDQDNPTHMPIPPVEHPCESHCCFRRIMPLVLAWARTIHKFQGLSAGPVDPGKIPNIFPSIVCDPDKREQERTALGLFYTALSRATTLGDANGDGSAIYFTGQDFNEARIRCIGKRMRSDADYVRAKQRSQWVSYLKKHIMPQTTMPDAQSVLQWAASGRTSHSQLVERIETYVNQRQKTNQAPFKIARSKTKRKATKTTKRRSKKSKL